MVQQLFSDLAKFFNIL